MNTRLLSFLALGFSALTILQALLGTLLFYHTIGFSLDAINNYYAPKSLHGLLEVLLPHTLFISIALMAITHFLSFIQTISENTKRIATHTLFLLFVLDQSSVLLIASGFEIFAIVKLFASTMFQISLSLVWIVMFKHTLKAVEKN
ncbi:hypothetical protein [Sulfurimonas sp.]|uniref:hypothetical protein n=1 Tax=Sulfurimonas sp. TaxID=2022749 RepID=UPI002635BEBC|nr:hypothetical protein [Sulfurimonas sp.]MDD5157165.1 hypothetical protein [Sulfurimonas sp.]